MTRKYKKLRTAKDLNKLMTRYYTKSKIIGRLAYGLGDQRRSHRDPRSYGHRLGLSRELRSPLWG